MIVDAELNDIALLGVCVRSQYKIVIIWQFHAA